MAPIHARISDFADMWASALAADIRKTGI